MDRHIHIHCIGQYYFSCAYCFIYGYGETVSEYNNFDFSVSYNGITLDGINAVINSITDPFGFTEQTILSTSDVPPKALIFKRIRRIKMFGDMTHDNYYFYLVENKP